jgi:hypothetical protein
MADSIKTPIGKFAFVNLFKPRKMPGGDKEKYECLLIVTPEFQKTPAYKAFQKAVTQCAKDEFGPDVVMSKLNLPIKKGSEMPYNGITDEDVVISARAVKKPGIVDYDKNDVMDPDDVWAGQWGYFEVRPFAYSVSNRGVSLNLNNVRVLKDGDRIDGRKSAQEVFSEDDEYDAAVANLPDPVGSAHVSVINDDDDDELLTS